MPVWMPPLPLPELKLLLIAALVALVLGVAGRWLTHILIRIGRSFSFFRELLPRVGAPLRLLLPLLGIQVIWSSAPDDMLFIDGIRRITTLAIIGAFTWFGLRTVGAVERLILLHNPLDISDNLRARRIQTQTRVLVRTLGVFVIIFGVSSMLMTFPSARQFGTSLLASARLAGLAVGFAAKPVLGNLIAGLQIAITQPIRVDDVVIVENEWGRYRHLCSGAHLGRSPADRALAVVHRASLSELDAHDLFPDRRGDVLGRLFRAARAAAQRAGVAMRRDPGALGRTRQRTAGGRRQ